MAKYFVAMVLVAVLSAPAHSQSRWSSDTAQEQAWAQQSSKSRQVTKQASRKGKKEVVKRVHRKSATPCAVRTWIGCHGWDPDPNVRMMMRMDAHHHDD